MTVPISVIVPVHNGSQVLKDCLTAVFASRCLEFECIVVDDGSTDDSLTVAGQFPVRVLSLGDRPHGPAYARNRGAAVARADILVFIDADVAIQPDTLSKVVRTLGDNPEVDAVFGSYDDRPAAGDFVSQYKNLLHHFVHQNAREEGGTFWSGCGAVRRAVFLALGGFDERRYPRPSIEDIDLGYRLRAAGNRILLNKDIQAKHLKRWSLRRMVESDLFDRAIPWTLLIFRDRSLPNDLNLQVTQRISAVLIYLALASLCLTALFERASVAILVPLTALVLLVGAYWRWPDARAPVMSRPAEIATAVLAVVAAGMAAAAGHWEVLPFIAPVIIAVGMRHSGLRVRWLRGRVGFVTALAGLVTAAALELAEHPSWLIVPLPISLFLVLVLNRRLYAFFIRQGGFLFALTVVPLHLLYLFYSVLAFVIGAGIYCWVNVAKPSTKPKQRKLQPIMARAEERATTDRRVGVG